ncbi:MAG TPA: MBL fold metallo-hydrolase [Micromonosporaceae bacterium]|nr:MBL fold metallo-hydrolase [Micromonosporaceae bacterium]
MTGFVEVGDRVHVLRHPVLDVNVTLVIGDGAALVVDTLSTAAQAAELARAVRAVTDQPWVIVNTHHHFDHCLGNAVLAGEPPCAVYAHAATAARLRTEPETVRRQAYEDMLPTHPDLADELTATVVLAPTHDVVHRAVLDLGRRTVELRHPGRAHTDGDLVVHVPDADVLVAGDLVEESGPPSFGDSYPLEWPQAVAELLESTAPATVVVPGHGAVVDRDFVRAQHDELAALAWLIRDGHADGAPAERVANRAPFGARAALPAVRRGFRELSTTT